MVERILAAPDPKGARTAPPKPPPLGVYRTFQVPIADIAHTTELSVPDLVDADFLQPVGAARAAAALSTREWIELGDYDDLTLT